jgi:hypothetical protein
MLSTDPKTGMLRKKVPELEELEDKMLFIRNFVHLCVSSSRSPVGKKQRLGGNNPQYGHGDSIATRVVAILKQRDTTGDYDHVIEHTQLLNTLALQAYLQLALDGTSYFILSYDYHALVIIIIMISLSTRRY